MDEHVPVTTFSTLIGTVAGVLMDPYTSFIAQLHAEGRVTDAELERLRHEFSDRMSRLGDLVAERLRQDRETTSPPPPPNQA
jgi:hypothetical protein